MGVWRTSGARPTAAGGASPLRPSSLPLRLLILTEKSNQGDEGPSRRRLPKARPVGMPGSAGVSLDAACWRFRRVELHQLVPGVARQRELGGQPGGEPGAGEEKLVARIGGHQVEREAGEDLAVRAAAAALYRLAGAGSALQMREQVRPRAQLGHGALVGEDRGALRRVLRLPAPPSLRPQGGPQLGAQLGRGAAAELADTVLPPLAPETGRRQQAPRPRRRRRRMDTSWDGGARERRRGRIRTIQAGGPRE